MKKHRYIFFLIFITATLLLIHNKAETAPPGWTPLPNLQYNMQVVALLHYDGGTSSTNTNDIVGAFVGTECRGVASPFSNGFIFLTIGSNLSAGEQITFKAYIASQDMVFDLDQTFQFSNQQQIGDPGNPFIFSYTTQAPILNANPSSLSFGSVQTGNCSTLSYLLTGSNLTSNITIAAPTGFQVSNSAGSGFANAITVTQSGGSVSQTVYVRFCPVAAQAYSGNVSNATSGASTVNVSLTGTGTSNCDPGWIPVGNLQYNMQMIGQIQFNGVTSFNANDIVGAFVGEVCRGIASPMGDGGLIFLTVGSNAASGEQVTFKLWNAQTCQQCNSSAVITFENQALIGNPGAPYIFSCAAANPELNATPSSLSFGIVQTGNCSTLSYLLTGSNLTANVTVTAPTGFQVSNSAGSGFANAITVTQSGGNVNQTVYVRFCPVAAQAYSGNVSNATSGASTVNVLVSGEGQYPPLPELFNVGGGGSYCAGTTPTGVSVTLNSSQSNITYQLKKNGTAFGSPINGTGNALLWTNQTAGIYTVDANNGYQTVQMTGSAVITESPILPVSVSVQASANNVCAGTQVSFTASPVNGGANPTYQWKKNGNNVGGNSPSYSYVPVNNDVVTVVLTSNANCTSVNPATSNAVTMAVNPLPQVSWNNFEPDTLCIFWEPMQLTGGLPLGGNYSGTGVSANFFSPSTAGYGSHTLLYTYTNEFNCTASANFTVFVDLCTSIVEKNVENEKVFVYPNPANTVLTIKFNDPYLLAFEHKIFNVLGQIVKEDRKTLKNGSLIHLEGLPTGFYFLQIMFDTTQTTTTFIIK